MEREGETSIGQILYIGLIGGVLNIYSGVIRINKRKVNDVQVGKRVPDASVVLKARSRKRLAEAPDAVGSVIDTSADFLDKASDVPIVRYEFFEEDAL